MPLPLLGLASLAGREYANTLPTYKERDDFLKVVSPHTYFTNQIAEYLADKFGIDSDLPRAQATVDRAGRIVYNNAPQGIDQATYDQQMADMQARTSTPEYAATFENNMRDMEYGTIDPAASYYVGPDAADSERSRLNEMLLPRRLESIPVESNFTPAQLDALRDRIYGVTPEVGPQQEPSQAPGGSGFGGAGGDFMPQGGGDYIPQNGGSKDGFTGGLADIEQYLRGGLIQRRR